MHVLGLQRTILKGTIPMPPWNRFNPTVIAPPYIMDHRRYSPFSALSGRTWEWYEECRVVFDRDCSDDNGCVVLGGCFHQGDAAPPHCRVAARSMSMSECGHSTVTMTKLWPAPERQIDTPRQKQQEASEADETNGRRSIH